MRAYIRTCITYRQTQLPTNSLVEGFTPIMFAGSGKFSSKDRCFE